MLPVDSVIRTGKVSGAQIMKWLEKELPKCICQRCIQKVWRLGDQIQWYASEVLCLW